MARVAIVGTGWGARTQVSAFRAAGIEVVGIAAQNRDKTRAVAAELNVKPFDDWRSLVDSNADLIVVSTPPATHREISLAVLEAGKHLVCEKPMALNVSEAEEMVRAAAARPGQIAMIDFELRFLPSWRAAEKLIREIAPIRYVEIRYSSPNWGDPRKEWKWWSDAALGGGVWGAVGSHYTDAIRHLVGDIEAARGILHTFIDERPLSGQRRKVTSDDFALAEFRLSSGALASVSCSAVAGVDEPTTTTIHGERGALRLSGNQLLRAGVNEQFSRVPVGEEEKSGNPFVMATDHLARALRARLDDGEGEALAPAATLEDGLAVQRAQDAARRSSAEGGRWVVVGSRQSVAGSQ